MFLVTYLGFNSNRMLYKNYQTYFLVFYVISIVDQEPVSLDNQQPLIKVIITVTMNTNYPDVGLC